MPNFAPLFLIAKLLVIVAPTIALTALWKRHTRTTWTPIVAAVAAFFVHALIRIPINNNLGILSFLLQEDYPHFYRLNLYFVAVAAIYGIAKETVRPGTDFMVGLQEVCTLIIPLIIAQKCTSPFYVRTKDVEEATPTPTPTQTTETEK